MRVLWLGALGCALAAGPAAAEPARPWRASAQVGGYLAATGPADYGAELTATLLPGGGWRRFGVRVSARTLEKDQGLFLVGGSFEAAASRPRLAVNIFAEVGATEDKIAVVGGGVRTTLWVIGPIALGGEGAAHLFVDGLDSSLALSGALVLGLAR